MNIIRKNTSTEYHELSGLLNIISAVLFFMFLLLKPYYLRPSGLIGAADLCLALSGVVMLISCVHEYARQRANSAGGSNLAKIRKAALGVDNGACKDRLWNHEANRVDHMAGKQSAAVDAVNEDGNAGKVYNFARTLLYRQDTPLYLFLVCVAVINGIYAYRLGSNEYIKYTLYWAYNILAIWTYRKLSEGAAVIVLRKSHCTAVAGTETETETETETGTETSVDEGTNPNKRKNIGKKADQKTGIIISFGQLVCLALEADIFIQFVIMLGGYGRIFTEYWDEGAIRYMGTFNDPNQLAFFMFVSLLLIFSIKAGSCAEYCIWADKCISLCRKNTNDAGILNSADTVDKANKTNTANTSAISRIATKAHLPLAFAAAIFIIIRTKSTGIMLGLVIFAGLLIGCALFNSFRRGSISRRQLILIIAAVIAAAAAFLYFIMPPADFNVQAAEYNLFTRIQEKLWKLSDGGIIGFFIDRGADRIVTFPKFMLFGAGEGDFARFVTLDGKVNELHSSLLSILFCYGIVPTAFICKWCIDALKRKNMWQLCAAAALIIESLTLINYRQPLFWFLLM